MMSVSETTIIASLAVLSLLLVIYLYAQKAVDYARSRTNALQETKRLLTAHYDALEKLLQAPEPSDELKKMLVWFSDAISNRKVARRYMQQFCSSDVLGDHQERYEGKLAAEFDMLRKTRPELGDLCEQVLSSGFIAMLLMWPEMSEMFKTAVSRIASNPRQELATAGKVIRIQRDIEIGNGGKAVGAFAA